MPPQLAHQIECFYVIADHMEIRDPASAGESSFSPATGAEELRVLNQQLREQADQLRALNQELIDREQRLRLSIEVGRVGVWVWDTTGSIHTLDWSRRLKEIFGLAPDAAITRELFLQCVHPEDRERVDWAIMQALAGVHQGFYNIEYRIVHPRDNSLHWVTAEGQAFFDAGGKSIRFIGAVVDISDRKQVEEFTARLNLELENRIANQVTLARLSQESKQAAIMAERNRMARDIHDTLAQGFTGIIAQLQAAKGATEITQALAHIERAEDLARSSLGEARRSVMALRPRSLQEASLGLALEKMIKTVAHDSGLNAEFTIEGEQRPISPDWEEGLLRVTQESLTNTIKHAHAQNFRATLSFEAQQIQLKLADDGCGFNPKTEHEGFGLIGMKERVDQMGGEFVICPRPGRGTETLITLPCPTALKSTGK